LLSSFPIST